MLFIINTSIDLIIDSLILWKFTKSMNLIFIILIIIKWERLTWQRKLNLCLRWMLSSSSKLSSDDSICWNALSRVSHHWILFSCRALCLVIPLQTFTLLTSSLDIFYSRHDRRLKDTVETLGHDQSPLHFFTFHHFQFNSMAAHCYWRGRTFSLYAAWPSWVLSSFPVFYRGLYKTARVLRTRQYVTDHSEP